MIEVMDLIEGVDVRRRRMRANVNAILTLTGTNPRVILDLYRVLSRRYGPEELQILLQTDEEFARLVAGLGDAAGVAKDGGWAP